MTSQWRRRAGSPFEAYKRECVASRGMVASNHPMASAAGVEMLAMGGNAVDAAIATAFTLTVVEPMMVGIFGSGLINCRLAGTGEFIHVDNYGVAPLAATPDMYSPVSNRWPDYLETEGRRNRVGHLAVAVPGALKAWCWLEETHGRLGLDTALRPAVKHAAMGFPASRYLVDIIAENREVMARYPATAGIFLPGGRTPALGQAIARTDYARTLEAVQRDGAGALYGGAVGEAVVRDMTANGGIITMDDLARYQFRRREPVRGTYRGYEIVSMGPVSSGGTHIVQVLNLLEGFDVAGLGFGTADGVHLLAEALKIAFADRFRYMGDPDVVDVPVEGLIAKGYADARRPEIDMERARAHDAGSPRVASGASDDTTHLTVADDEGNVVAMTQTIHEAFGSKVTVPGTGMLLNNNMYLFDPHPGHANSVAPGKRMLSSMSPTVVMRNGRPFMALGTPGGTKIFAAVLQAIVNVIDHGMTLQEAVEAPRVWTQGQELNAEEGISPGVREALEARGHRVEVVPRVAGGMNGVMFDEAAGALRGAACWRADGAPIGISGGPAKPGARGATFRI